MAYSEKVIDHYSEPRNVGSLDKSDLNVGTGLVGAPECGDVMKLQIQVDPETKEIVDAKFKTFGCVAAIAVSNMVSEMAKGKTLQDAKSINKQAVADELDGLPKEKMHCSNLGAEALAVAIQDYEAKMGHN